MKQISIGIIGGGLMGREMASAFARWCALDDMPVTPVLRGVADLNPAALDWFRRLPGADLLTIDYRELIHSPRIDVEPLHGELRRRQMLDEGLAHQAHAHDSDTLRHCFLPDRTGRHHATPRSQHNPAPIRGHIANPNALPS